MRKNDWNTGAFVTALLVAGLSTSAHATNINTITDGRWYQFDVDELISGNLRWVDGISDADGLYQGDFSDLSFTFTLNNPGKLTIVDAAIAGDEFQISVNGQTYNSSLSLDPDSTSVGTDFDAAFSDNHRYSYLTLQLNPGTYTVTGLLTASAVDNTGEPFNATVGGLSISEVPLPSSSWLLGTALMGCVARTRRHA